MMEYITVACRLPHGLHMDLGVAPDNKRVTLNGANKSRIIGGAGITQVPKDHWEEWAKTRRNAPYIQNGAIFLTKSEGDAIKEADSRAKDLTGFEQASPDKFKNIAKAEVPSE